MGFSLPDSHTFCCFKARSEEPTQQPARSRAEGELGLSFEKRHSSPVPHIHLQPGPMLTALHLPVLPWSFRGLFFPFAGCQRGLVLEVTSPPVQGVPWLAPFPGKAAGAAREAEQLKKYSPK